MRIRFAGIYISSHITPSLISTRHRRDLSSLFFFYMHLSGQSRIKEYRNRSVATAKRARVQLPSSSLFAKSFPAMLNVSKDLEKNTIRDIVARNMITLMIILLKLRLQIRRASTPSSTRLPATTTSTTTTVNKRIVYAKKANRQSRNRRRSKNKPTV